MDSLDLNSIEKTELLASHAAKDKIMLKSKRMSARQPRKTPDNQSLTSLPSLSEEARPTSEAVNGNLGSDLKTVVLEETPPPPSPTTQSPAEDSSGVASRKLNLQFVTTTAKENKQDLTSPPSSSPALSPSAATNASSPLFKSTSPTTPNARFPPQKFAGLRSPETQNQAASGSHNSAHASLAAKFSANTSDKKINEPGSHESNQTNTKDTSKEFDEIKASSTNAINESQKELEGIKAETNIKSRMNQFQTPAVVANKFGPTASVGRLPLKSSGLDTSAVSPTKEESKVKQWGRGSTLPTATDSQTSTGAQKGISNQTKTFTQSFTKIQDSPTQTDSDKTTPSSTTPTNPPSSGARKQDSITTSSENSQSLPAFGQPWRNQARMKDAETKKPEESSQLSPTSINFSGSKTSGHHSVLMSASRTDMNRGGLGMTSNKNQNMSDLPSKKEDTDTHSSNLPNENVNSTKTGSSVAEMSDLNSVKSVRSLFASGPKSSNQKTTVSAQLSSDRFKSVQGSSSASSASTTNSQKPVSTQETADAATSGLTDVAPVPTSEGTTQIHRGTAVSAFARPQDSSSAIQKRGFNFKGGSVISSNAAFNQPFGAAASSMPNKTDTTTTPNPDNSGASSSSTSSKPGGYAFKHSQLNSSLPSQTSSSTPPTFAVNVKSFHGDSLPKSPTNFPLASQPAGSSAHPGSKPTTTTNLPASSFKSAPSGIGTAATKFSFTNTSASSSSVSATNIPKPVSSTISDVTSPTPSTTSSPFNKSFSTFSTPASFKPQTFSGSASHPKHTQVQTPAPQTATPPASSKTPETTTSEKALEDKKTDLPAKVPAWRANLVKKEANVEPANKASLAPSPSSSQPSPRVLKKFSDKDKISETSKKTESLSSSDVIMQVEMAPGKPSKVLNMIKNFQNVTAPS